MWLSLRLIDFHHRHIVEAFTTWNQLQLKENGKVTLTMGFHKIVVFFSSSHSCCINVPILYLWVTVTLLTSYFFLCIGFQ